MATTIYAIQDDFDLMFSSRKFHGMVKPYCTSMDMLDNIASLNGVVTQPIRYRTKYINLFTKDASTDGKETPNDKRETRQRGFRAISGCPILFRIIVGD